jgi:hypothetical protein
MSESEHLTTPARRRLITWRGLTKLVLWLGLVALFGYVGSLLFLGAGLLFGYSGTPIVLRILPLAGLLLFIGICIRASRRQITGRGLTELALWLVALLLCVGTLLFLGVGVLFDDSGLPTLPIVTKILALPVVLLLLIGICIRKSRRLATQRPRLAFWLVAAPILLVIGGAGIVGYVLYAS